MSSRAWLIFSLICLFLGTVYGWTARVIVEKILLNKGAAMARAQKIKSAAAAHKVPQNRQEVVEMISQIGTHQRERQRLKADMDDQITAIRETFDSQLTPHSQAIESLTNGVHIWCEANRSVLTNNNKVKTANLMTGEIKWRMRPTSCRAIKLKEAIEEVKLAGLEKRFLRQKEELNKEAILADPDAVKGFRWLALEQGEDFVIVPFETDIEEVA